MRMLKSSIIIVLFITFFIAPFSFAAETKIGVFDLDKIMSDSKMGKATKSKLEGRHKALKTALERKKDEVEKMDEKLEKDRVVLGPEKYKKQKFEIQKKALEFRELEAKSTEEMRNLRRELLGNINKEITKYLEKIGKKENYTIIVEKNIAGAAYYSQKIDLTNRIIRELNK